MTTSDSDTLVKVKVITSYGEGPLHEYRSVGASDEEQDERLVQILTTLDQAMLEKQPVLILHYPLTLYKTAHIVRIDVDLNESKKHFGFKLPTVGIGSSANVL